MSAGPPWKGDVGPDFILDRVCSGQISPWERHVVSFHSILKGEKSLLSWLFFVSLRKITQHALRSTYSWVPQQTWNRTWTDEELYANRIGNLGYGDIERS